jgi:XTP/dITP diphosphohydrolase
MQTYILASGNKGKLAEFRELVKDDEVLTMKEIGFTEEIIEDGNSFEENALIKARAIQTFLKKS